MAHFILNFFHVLFFASSESYLYLEYFHRHQVKCSFIRQTTNQEHCNKIVIVVLLTFIERTYLGYIIFRAAYVYLKILDVQLHNTSAIFLNQLCSSQSIARTLPKLYTYSNEVFQFVTKININLTVKLSKFEIRTKTHDTRIEGDNVYVLNENRL